MNKPILSIKELYRTFPAGDGVLQVLRGISLDLYLGELVALVGPSGAGKSTLLHTAGLLEEAQSGEIMIAGKDCAKLSDFERTRMRLDVLGFVYQFHHLLPEFTAEENIILPQMIAGKPMHVAQVRARTLLSQVGLIERSEHRPARLSGGEQQRTAIARALANQPQILLADEPTGNLDEATADRVFSILVDLVRQQKLAALVATHNLELARRMDRIVSLHDGKLVEMTQLDPA